MIYNVPVKAVCGRVLGRDGWILGGPLASQSSQNNHFQTQ